MSARWKIDWNDVKSALRHAGTAVVALAVDSANEGLAAGVVKPGELAKRVGIAVGIGLLRLATRWASNYSGDVK